MINFTEHDLFPELEIEEGADFKIRKTTRIFVVNEDNQIALVENKWSPHHFLLPGGGVDEGESWVDGAKRECLEELGANVTEPVAIARCTVWHHRPDGDGTTFDVQYFKTRLVSLGEPTTTDPREQGRQTRWLSTSAALELIRVQEASTKEHLDLRPLRAIRYLLEQHEDKIME